MKKLIIIISSSLLLIAGTVTFSGCKENTKAKTEQVAENAEYQCPMKCEGDKTYDKPGRCPKCGMNLEKTDKNEHAGHNHK